MTQCPLILNLLQVGGCMVTIILLGIMLAEAVS